MSHTGRRVVAVGLTGGIGAGKSTALGLFGKEGAVTVSADQIVHDLYGTSGVAERLAEHFGREVLNEQGTVDRTALARKLRGRRGELTWLERTIHPLVTKEIERRIQEAPDGSVVVCEVPLLFEAGYQTLFDLVVTIEAGGDARRSRSIHSFDLEQFSELERLQASTDERVRGSHIIFFNDGEMEALEAFVRDAHRQACLLVELRA